MLKYMLVCLYNEKSSVFLTSSPQFQASELGHQEGVLKLRRPLSVPRHGRPVVRPGPGTGSLEEIVEDSKEEKKHRQVWEEKGGITLMLS